MNKINNKYNIKSFVPIVLHIVICVIVLAIPLYMMSRSGNVDFRHYTGYFVRTCILFILFYINYLYLIDRFLFNKKFITYIILNIVIAALLLLFQNFLQDTLFRPEILECKPPAKEMIGYGRPQKERVGGPPFGFEMRIWGDYIVIILVIGLSVAVRTTQRWYKDSINLEQVKTAQLEADLKNLRSQLNPHFLFNTLNNIYSLIAIDKDKAQDSIHRLSNLLRYILYDNNENFVPIDKELSFTRDYIDLMRLRLTPNTKLTVSIDNDSNEKIAPLLFMTLIENAFKHGVNTGDKESFIDINIKIKKDVGVLFTVENSLRDDCSKNMESKNSGIGLSNLSQRLNLIYPNSYEFIIEKREKSFFTLLRITFDTPNSNN